MRKRILSILLVVSIVSTMFVGTSLSARATSYNANAAISYAVAHWDDGVGKCATFVSNCLNAGGCTASSSVVGTLKNALINGGWGTLYELKRNPNKCYAIKDSDNSGKLSYGDPIFYYCKKCENNGPWSHVVICSGFDSSGYARVYAHNNPKNNEVIYDYNHKVNGVTHSGTDMIAYSVHMQPHTHSYSTFIYYGKSHPHYNYYKCSCGDIKMSNETNILDNCEICNPTLPGKPTLTVTSSDETKMVGFVWNKTERTNNYDLRVIDENSVNVLTVWSIEGLYYACSLKPGTYTAWVCSNSDVTYTSSDRVNFTVSERSFDYKPSKTVTVGNKLFSVFEYNVSLEEAKQVAQSFGGRLANIENEAEQKAIFNTIKSSVNHRHWIDGSDSETEGVWKHSNGNIFTYSNWGATEPNNRMDYWGDEDYVVISSDDGKWVDISAVDKDCYYFIVENQLSYNANFPDVNYNDWYGNAVQYATSTGLIKGYSNGKFGTSDNIQRQDFIVILARLSGDDLSHYKGKSSFKDVPTNAYYAPALAWAKAKGISSGYTNGKFGVGDRVTREQIMTFFYNYAKQIRKGDTEHLAGETAMRIFVSDYSEISKYAVTSVRWAFAKGIISGKTNSADKSGQKLIAPKAYAKRCEIAAMFYNIEQKSIFAK